jgi:hypothetical protein
MEVLMAQNNSVFENESSFYAFKRHNDILIQKL